ncbi:phospho-sugar mutase [Lipingzhangella sp. LS1_29]|uniref:Phospho-sugar mutase n=1 Tax=Lipingzhangella rawalii TaxID=2055835 RepID=A0ABU2H824_9ACTN|nr:phospho-sugar mutase [Lipingzhangella rawalii]MDS1270999.1 phospho-sugar mutase [Lipingzhangella rawalii]
MQELYRQAREWMAQDPDPRTRAELEQLLATAPSDSAAEDELADRFRQRLQFGTAGLRGALGAGPNRMNRVTVLRAAAGLAAWLHHNHDRERAPLVVVGYDARHNSARFAVDTASVLSAAGIIVRCLPEPLPTPVLAHTVADLGAAAGVMVTASHNPPQDNGYKVYVGGAGPAAGSQILPPIDTEISAAIDAVGPVDQLPLDEEGWRTFGTEPVHRYLDSLSQLPLGPDRDLSVTYTPLHGVGAETLQAAFARHGFPAPHLVPQQARPDPDFPTVAFPNPEEPGALDLALAEADRVGSDLVLANDPDADRLAAAVPGHGMLTGDEVGALLAEHVLAHTSGPDRIVATTVVSASLLSTLASAYGVRYEETLTGFKWLARVGGDGSDPARCVCAYEEALGYCLAGDTCRPVADKDGIGAALVLAAVAATAKRSGRTLVDLRDEQARRYGLHLTRQLTRRFANPAERTAVMARLRQHPPTQLAQLRVSQVVDLATGEAGLPPTDAIRYQLTGPVTARLVVRPSGTEPKLKCYLEVVCAPQDDVSAARAEASRQMDELAEAVHGLVLG